LKTAIVYDEKYAQYDLGEGHPFRGDRFTNTIKYFTDQGLFKHPDITMIQPKPAHKEDLLRVHDAEYVNYIHRLAAQSRPYDIETPVTPQILQAIMHMIGGAITAGKTVQEGTTNHAVAIGGGFHHAGRDYGGGFCLFNDIAITIEYLRTNHNLKRALIIDYDVHAGNGTSDIYYQDPTVLFISIHQDPKTIYPGTGFIEQIGQGLGTGYNINIPLPPQTGDQTYLHALNEILPPLAQEFKPEIIIGNGGSDPHFADTLGNLNLTTQAFLKIAQTITKTAQTTCNGKTILLPGSGYNPEVLPQCWYALTAGIAGINEIDTKEPYTPPIEPEYVQPKVEDTLKELKKLLKKYWKCFS
jgi:acetoin utilization protein AcuC